MKNGNLLIALIVGGTIGFVIGKSTQPKTDAPTAAAAPSAPNKPAPGQAEGPNTVFKVPLRDAASKGPATAKVTIVEFSDFQCPFCSRVGPTLKQIEDTYGKDVRIAFKHNPLPFHADAPLASEATLAAHEQGKFFEMHDKLFANQQNLKREDLEKYAAELGLDMNRFKAALDGHKYQAQIDRDKAEAAALGARGTPSFFINGRKLRGAQPFDAFKNVIDEELKKADAALARGVKAENLYNELTKDGLTEAPPPAPQPNQPQKPAAPEPPAGSKVAKVTDLAGSPSRGPANAKVTMVLWSDFQCPFCSRVEPTVTKILEAYPKDVRVIWKNQPLPFHNQAMPAAIAAMAAGEQGKFWEMHEKLFANQKELNEANYEKWAGEIGLNVSKWKAAVADPKIKAKVEADSKYGSQVGADGTPTFYINGREIAGAMPFEAFKAVIDDEIKKADEQLKKGVKDGEIYAKMLEYNAANAPKGPPPAPGDDGQPVKIDIGSSPVRGDKSAPVAVVVWSDFQCPFCSRAVPTVDQILEKYKGKVKFVFKNQPLPFHNNAMAAAKAALAAGEQGKYWEMHDLMFKNQQALSPADLEKYAGELNLNMSKFKAAMDSASIQKQIDADIAAGNGVGANGTPTFFVNGRKLVGAQPFDAFAKLIDEELAKKK
jgi:protein-disulfide isomerase